MCVVDAWRGLQPSSLVTHKSKFRLGSSTGEEESTPTSISDISEDMQTIGSLYETINLPRAETSKRVESKVVGKEEVFRKYQFTGKGLPVLEDVNNYWSGKFDQFFWHQNADQVHVFCPIPADVFKCEIEVRFEVHQVVVNIRGKDFLTFKPFDRIIPDGCFWTLEEDRNRDMYIMLDLEKRFRMLNWNALLADHRNDQDNSAAGAGNEEEKRADLLKKLFAANKGLAKMTGVPEESWSEMMEDEKMLKAISAPVSTTPKVIRIMEDGTEHEIVNVKAPDMQEVIRERFEAAQEELKKKGPVASDEETQDE